MNLKAKQFIDSYIGIPLVYIHVVLAKFLGKILHRNHSLQQTPKEIVIIKLLGFGSVIMASDAIFSIKKKHPSSTLSIVCSKGIADGISSLHLFDKVYIVNDSSLIQTFLSSIKIISTLFLTKNIWTVDLEVYSKLTSIFSLWTKAQNRFGFYFNQVAFRYNLNTHNIYFNTNIQVEENYKKIIEALGVETFYAFSIHPYTEKNTSNKQTFIAINNTCSELAPERKMNENQLYELCNWIAINTQYAIVLLGASSDKNYNDNFIEKFHLKNIENIAGKYSLEKYYDFLYHNCKLLITIDSAPLHIANKLNIPTISIWGPTSPQSRINIEDKNNDYIYLHASCSPCTHFIEKLPCNGNNFCINNVTLSSLTQLILKYIA